MFHKALSECGSLEVRPVAICMPQEIQEYCMELFGENVQIAAASHDLFAKRVNGQIYRPLVEKYIAGAKRLYQYDMIGRIGIWQSLSICSGHFLLN